MTEPVLALCKVPVVSTICNLAECEEVPIPTLVEEIDKGVEVLLPIYPKPAFLD